ncbi:MAG: phosphate acyltransferase, partial [Alphaproteobacteria bacterium]|nr:phosphate acyltransferase [Alphaproteobacteria bacterium]
MSEQKKIIAVDAMSGDKGPSAVLGGINQFLYQNGEDKVHFRLFGDEKRLRRMLTKYPRVGRNVEVVHAPGVIKGTDKIMDIVRHAQDTSMYMA